MENKAKKIEFEIVTPERVAYKDIVDQVTIPTQSGEITVLPGHIPLVSMIQTGVITVKKGDEENYLSVSGGFIEVRPPSRIIVMADAVERAEEISEAEAEAARKRAEETLKKKETKSDVEFTEAAALLERSLAQLKVAGKYKKRKTRRRIDT